MEYLEDKTDTCPLEDGLYRFKCIKDHKGSYTSSDPEYNGSSYNLLIEWETGEQTWEPLSNIIASEPYTCAVYAKKHDLLNTPGWKLSKRHSKSNNKWKDATDLEHEQIKEFQVVKDFGRAKAVYYKKHITNVPSEHQKIRVHFAYDVKHCTNFKARLLADGHFTKEPMETQECSLQSPIIWNYAEQMLDMHRTFKHSQGRNFTLWVVLNVGMINSLRYYIKWVSSLQEQTQIHG